MNSLLNALTLAASPRMDRSISERVWFTDPNATFASEQDPVYMFIFWVSAAFFVPMMLLMFYWVWKYRRIPGKPQERSPAHNTPLEITWSVVPLFLMVLMFVWGFRGYLFMHVAPAGAEEIQLTAYQWNWEATYENGARSSEMQWQADKQAPVFYVPAGRPIKLIMSSRDVIHAFFVPDFRTKIDIMPNRYTTIWFEAMEAGREHYLFCAEYCGDGHSQMGALLRVVTEAEYAEWKAKAADIFTGADGAPKPLTEVGELIYRMKGCNSCHTVDGSANVGPTWLGVYGSQEQLTGGGTVTVDENYIRESILVPAAKIVAGFPNQMTSYQGQITDRELAAVIAYIKSLSDAGRAELDAAPQADPGAETPDGAGG